jgi:hypothetical protein
METWHERLESLTNPDMRQAESEGHLTEQGKSNMRTSVALLFALLATPVAVSQQQKTYELRGDYLGESLASFKQRHPKAYCYDVNDAAISCHDKDGSFAGHSPYGCDEEKDCYLVGLRAGFFKGRLSLVGYDVSGLDSGGGDPFELLSKKYGKPRFLYDTDTLLRATWTSNGQQIRLWIVKNEPRPGISVELEYEKDPATGDI